MGILVKQNENRSQYQERLAAELRERAKQQAITSEPMDQTKHSNYLKNTAQTSDRLWLWAAIAVLLLIGFVIFMVSR
jgi:thiaminase